MIVLPSDETARRALDETIRLNSPKAIRQAVYRVLDEFVAARSRFPQPGSGGMALPELSVAGNAPPLRGLWRRD
jgi:hypothetical protein